jgi:hypothetical protein
MSAESFRQETALLNPSRSLRMRRLAHPEGEVLILLNSGCPDTAVLRFSENGLIIRLDGDEEYPTDPHSLLGLPLFLAAQCLALTGRRADNWRTERYRTRGREAEPGRQGAHVENRRLSGL